jgi:hypothetical protein
MLALKASDLIGVRSLRAFAASGAGAANASAYAHERHAEPGDIDRDSVTGLHSLLRSINGAIEIDRIKSFRRTALYE